MKQIVGAASLAAIVVIGLAGCADRSIRIGGPGVDPYAEETNPLGTRDARRGIVDRPWRDSGARHP